MTECSERIQENMYTWPIPSKNIYHIPLNGVLFSAKFRENIQFLQQKLS